MNYLKSKLEDWAIKYLKSHGSSKVFHEVAKDLFNTVDENDILRIEEQNGKSVVWFKGKRLPVETVEKLQRDADMFSRSDIWELMYNDARYKANKAMYDDSKNEMDMLAGKMMLYSLKVLDKRIKYFRNIQ